MKTILSQQNPISRYKDMTVYGPQFVHCGDAPKP